MRRREWAGYLLLLTACLLASVAVGWTTLGAQFDNDIYDFLFRILPDTHTPRSVIAGVDEESLRNGGGARRLRRIVAAGLEAIARAGPKAVVMDVLFADEGETPEDRLEDETLAAALARTPNLVLATSLVGGSWEDPLPAFSRSAVALGHIHAQPDPYDNVIRELALEKASADRRRWALALEAYRLWRGGADVLEDPDGIEIGGMRVPARRSDSRALRIRYARPQEPYQSSVPVISIHQLRNDPTAAAKVQDKVVFFGITAQSAAQDRHMTPVSYGLTMPGVEIHANAFETLARGAFLVPASNASVVLLSLCVCAAAGVIFWQLSGWPAYTLAGLLLAFVHLIPYFAFRAGVIFPYMPPFATAWLSLVGAAAYHYFFIRRAKERYQRAIHFVVHEMRTPLTAIQGSSELMGRYKLPEDKRAEMARMINTESKRLARLIQTFLDVERLTQGQMELKRDPFDLRDVVDVSLDRVRPLAERKRIRVTSHQLEPSPLIGDRELMEYAVYNLLTNAIKYSPADTEVIVSAQAGKYTLRLSVRDQGMGMNERELKRIFQKFYRTKNAEKSGESGTGIGLSIVEQIVTHHGGRMEVTSTPGAGSCFTIVMPAAALIK
jgi:signal transduction histidine kinase